MGINRGIDPTNTIIHLMGSWTTLIHYAIAKNRLEIVRVLLNKYHEMGLKNINNIRDSCGRTLLHAAINIGGMSSILCAQLLQNFGARNEPDDNGETPLEFAQKIVSQQSNNEFTDLTPESQQQYIATLQRIFT